MSRPNDERSDCDDEQPDSMTFSRSAPFIIAQQPVVIVRLRR
jgi:hypothetical protein